MPKEFDLLPEEFVVDKDITHKAGLLKKISLALFVTLLVLVGFLTLLLSLFSRQQKDLNQQISDLKSDIKSLEPTEQGLILVKDRAQKIQATLSSRSSEENFDKADTLATDLPEKMSLKSIEIGPEKGKLILNSLSSRDLYTFMRAIKTQEFKSLMVNSVTFNPFVGYTISFEIN